MEINETAGLGSLYAAMAAAQGAMRGALKDTTGQIGQQKTKYADLASCWDSCRDALAKNGVAVIQIPSAAGAQVTVKTILGHKSGQELSSELTITSQGGTPQQIGSAITYARRYGLCAMVGIAPEDDDGAAAGGTAQGSKEAQQRVAKELIEKGDKKEPAGKKSTDFDTLKKFKQARAKLGEEDYYRILRSYNAEHANDIVDPEAANKCLRAMAGWLNVSEPWVRLEHRDKARFAALLTGEGCLSIADAVANPDSAGILTRLELQMSTPQGPREKLKQLEARDEEAFWKIVAGGYGHDEEALNKMGAAQLEDLLAEVQTAMDLGV